jgi:hypothetical protein
MAAVRAERGCAATGGHDAVLMYSALNRTGVKHASSMTARKLKRIPAGNRRPVSQDFVRPVSVMRPALLAITETIDLTEFGEPPQPELDLLGTLALDAHSRSPPIGSARIFRQA